MSYLGMLVLIAGWALGVYVVLHPYIDLLGRL